MQVEVKLDADFTEPKVIILANRITEEVNAVIQMLSETEPKLITGFREDIKMQRMKMKRGVCMEQSIRRLENIQPEFDFDQLIDLSEANESGASSVVKNVSSEGTTARAGVQTKSLQSAIDNYASAMNKSAIAKSTGLPVRTASQQYKGFIAEEYFKHTLKIKALAKGVPN